VSTYSCTTVHRSTWIEQLLPGAHGAALLEPVEYSSLGADTAAPLQHMVQWLPWSTESSSAGARGAVALLEKIQLLH